MSNAPKLRSRPSRETTGPRPGTSPDDLLGRVIRAAVVATSSPPAVGNLCHQLAAASAREDNGVRLCELADAATLERATAAAVIRVLASTAAALGGIAAGR